eukprot:768550-Hanusia_phi.AAC.3
MYFRNDPVKYCTTSSQLPWRGVRPERSTSRNKCMRTRRVQHNHKCIAWAHQSLSFIFSALAYIASSPHYPPSSPGMLLPPDLEYELKVPHQMTITIPIKIPLLL